MLDGKNIKDLNTCWLRNNIGVVSQEPILFGMTIAENIKLGNTDATIQEIEDAAKAANAHDFITRLPNVSLIAYLEVDLYIRQYYTLNKIYIFFYRDIEHWWVREEPNSLGVRNRE